MRATVSLVKAVAGAIGIVLDVPFGLFVGVVGLSRLLGVVVQTLIVHHVLQGFFSGLEVVPSPVEHLLTYDFLLFLV